jgi:hypothetical protein
MTQQKFGEPLYDGFHCAIKSKKKNLTHFQAEIFHFNSIMPTR